MKLKIQKLSKKDYDEVYISYMNTDRGREQMNRLMRLNIMGIVGLFLAVIYYLYNQDMGIVNIVIISSLIIFSLLFIIGSYKLKRDSLNNYLVNNPKILGHEKKSCK